MTDTIFLRWRISMTALILGAEALWLMQGMREPLMLLLTILAAFALQTPHRSKKIWFLTFLPAIWLLVCSVLRLSVHFAEYALTALHPALCALAFSLACVQLARHGREPLYQWSWPVAWLVGLGFVLALLLGWPEIDDLWFMLLVLPAELGRCAALIDLLQ